MIKALVVYGIGDEILPSYRGIVISYYEDPGSLLTKDFMVHVTYVGFVLIAKIT